jgi:glycine/D-amino acid oxidase-like deaminating enzyme
MTLTSLWQDRHPRSTAPQAPVEVSGETEVVVVGAGLTGLTTAVLLARAGKAVTVLEARHVGAVTTGGSTAKVSLLQGTQLSRIARRHPMGTVRQYVEANAEGQAWVARFCDDHGVATQRRPAYTFGFTTAGARSAQRELKLARAAGLEAEWVDEPPLPFGTQGAVRLADQLQLDPLELTDALAAEAAKHGVHLVEGVRVRRVREKDPVVVTTDHGTLRAQTVVIATNMPILDRGGFFARMKPERSYGLAFATPTMPVDGMYLSADSPSRSLRETPDGDGGYHLLVGGEGHKTGGGHPTTPRLDALRSWTHEHFPGVVETHAWSAQDYSPAHALPFAGPVLPGSDEIFVAGGYSKWGMTNGVAAALALSGRILGGHMPWAEVFRPWRSRELRGSADGALLNAEVAVEMARGWIRPLARPSDVRYDHVGAPSGVADDGASRRVSAVCTHLGGIVRWNDAERSWDCPLHGSRFDADGEVLEGPATCGLKAR